MTMTARQVFLAYRLREMAEMMVERMCDSASHGATIEESEKEIMDFLHEKLDGDFDAVITAEIPLVLTVDSAKQFVREFVRDSFGDEIEFGDETSAGNVHAPICTEHMVNLVFREVGNVETWSAACVMIFNNKYDIHIA